MAMISIRLSPARCIQAVFILSSCIVLAMAVLPTAERKLLLSYGPRRSQDEIEEITKSSNETATALGQVPHSWFFTYYAFYSLCAAFWTTQYFQERNRSNLLRAMAQTQLEMAPASSTTTGTQLALVWVMMMLQAVRRLYECFVVMKPSKSTMWFLHWVMGLGFYFGISMAIWVESSASPSAADFTTETTMKAAVALPLFAYGWFMQYHCHRNLAKLKKYSLPDQGLFCYLVCPHYACECLIYSSLAIAAAPTGRWCNQTLLSGAIFVVVNLGVTALGTRTWYAERFGMEKVASKWIMIPFLY
ncbi:hypothetical protein BD289DRAFT_459545 [Coniella lustricola]|uniref:Polyprenal reductase n=1 Tax=Coniella lustricola TaxID=2025994 RepID=A0A2T3AEA6_9PEZI|nr:hypothetical protein BD289DRAFT_459545 [Coniella lustricola]